MASHQGNSSRKRRFRRYARYSPKAEPKIFFCGDPHGKFDHINAAVKAYRPDAIVLLGDMQPPAPIETLLAETLALTEVWWIPGNHDTDTEEYYDRLWKGPLASRNLHGKVATIAGIRIAGLGGVFRGQIWMPEGFPNFRSTMSFVRNTTKSNLWRGGLPRRHRTSIFPSVYDALMRQKADVLVTHEAAGCHKKGFVAIDRLAKALHVQWHFHGHQHEDHDYGCRDGVYARAVGYRGIVDLKGNVIVESELDPRDILALQQAGEEPAPEVLDCIGYVPLPEIRHPRPRRRFRYGQASQTPSESSPVKQVSVD